MYQDHSGFDNKINNQVNQNFGGFSQGDNQNFGAFDFGVKENINVPSYNKELGDYIKNFEYAYSKGKYEVFLNSFYGFVNCLFDVKGNSVFSDTSFDPVYCTGKDSVFFQLLLQCEQKTTQKKVRFDFPVSKLPTKIQDAIQSNNTDLIPKFFKLWLSEKNTFSSSSNYQSNRFGNNQSTSPQSPAQPTPRAQTQSQAQNGGKTIRLNCLEYFFFSFAHYLRAPGNHFSNATGTVLCYDPYFKLLDSFLVYFFPMLNPSEDLPEYAYCKSTPIFQETFLFVLRTFWLSTKSDAFDGSIAENFSYHHLYATILTTRYVHGHHIQKLITYDPSPMVYNGSFDGDNNLGNNNDSNSDSDNDSNNNNNNNNSNNNNNNNNNTHNDVDFNHNNSATTPRIHSNLNLLLGYSNYTNTNDTPMGRRVNTFSTQFSCSLFGRHGSCYFCSYAKDMIPFLNSVLRHCDWKVYRFAHSLYWMFGTPWRASDNHFPLGFGLYSDQCLWNVDRTINEYYEEYTAKIKDGQKPLSKMETFLRINFIHDYPFFFTTLITAVLCRTEKLLTGTHVLLGLGMIMDFISVYTEPGFVQDILEVENFKKDVSAIPQIDNSSDSLLSDHNIAAAESVIQRLCVLYHSELLAKTSEQINETFKSFHLGIRLKNKKKPSVLLKWLKKCKSYNFVITMSEFIETRFGSNFHDFGLRLVEKFEAYLNHEVFNKDLLMNRKEMIREAVLGLCEIFKIDYALYSPNLKTNFKQSDFEQHEPLPKRSSGDNFLMTPLGHRRSQPLANSQMNDSASSSVVTGLQFKRVRTGDEPIRPTPTETKTVKKKRRRQKYSPSDYIYSHESPTVVRFLYSLSHTIDDKILSKYENICHVKSFEYIRFLASQNTWILLMVWGFMRYYLFDPVYWSLYCIYWILTWYYSYVFLFLLLFLFTIFILVQWILDRPS